MSIPTTNSEIGAIEDNVTYPLPQFKKLAGLSDWAIRMAVRRGLKVRRCGRRAYVRGCDWSQYLESSEGGDQ